MSDYQHGDRVRIKPPYFGQGRGGMVAETRDGHQPPIQVSVDGLGRWWYQPHELEKDGGHQMDRTQGTNTAGCPGVPGSPIDDAVDRDAGEHPTSQGSTPVAPVAVETFEALSDQEPLGQQVTRLATVLIEEFGGPTQSEGAIDMAIRLLRQCRAELDADYPDM